MAQRDPVWRGRAIFVPPCAHGQNA